MNLRKIAARVRRVDTPEHALAQAAFTFCGFVVTSQFSILLAVVLLVVFIFLKNG